MANTLYFLRTATTGKQPTTAQLASGQIALNVYDGKIFVGGNNGSAFVGAIGSGTIAGDVTGTLTGAAGATTTLTLAATGVTAGTFAGLVVNAKGLITSATALTTLAGYGITNGVATAQLGVASGVATLDSSGHLTVAQLPASVVGAMSYQGTWNASTNSPTLASGTGTKGYIYRVTTAGTTTLDGNSQWNVGDEAVFDGTTWDKWDGIASEVTGFNGRTGNVTPIAADYSAFYQTSGTNSTITISGDASGSGANAITLTLASSGVTAGTYAGHVVNAKGLVTSATVLTTVAGYGITDALTVNSVIDLGTF